MTIQEKKSALIKQIKNENSEEMIDRIYDDVTNIKSWQSEYGKNILNQLLAKSQEEAREGKTRPYKDLIEEAKTKYCLNV